MNGNQKKTAGIASLVLGLFAWISEKLGWISAKVANVLNLVSLGLGALVTFA